MLNRREFVMNTAASAALRCIPIPTPGGLLDAARRSPWLIGGATTIGEIDSDSSFANRFVREFSMVTPAMELKWNQVHPAPGEYHFDLADKIFRWADSHSLMVRGHNLIWPNYGTPKWVAEYTTAANAEALLEEHIGTVVGRYAGKLHSWDVLNEPLNIWDRRSDLLAVHPWVELIGPHYIDLAFHSAARADPHARLIWNQNYLESDDHDDEQNRLAFLSHLRRLKKANVPIHGIGIESHLFAEKPLARERLARFLGEVQQLGLEVQITELDVNDTQLPFNLTNRDDLVADTYKRYLELMMRLANPSVIAFWTLSDRRNWLDWAAKDTPKYARFDGKLHRPGLLDENLQNKPAYAAVRSALSEANR